MIRAVEKLGMEELICEVGEGEAFLRKWNLIWILMKK